MFSTNKLNQCEVDFEGKWDAVAKKEDTVGIQQLNQEGRNFRHGCENFARIAKISQS